MSTTLMRGFEAMAVKKKATTKKTSPSASQTKAAPKKVAAAAKPAATKAAAAKPAAAKPAATKPAAVAAKTVPAVKAGTASKAGTPKPKAGVATKKAAPKKVPVVKLTDRQLDLLKVVHGTKEAGYLADKKAEAKSLETLATKKLIKKGAKDKASGHIRYHVSKAGEKHVSSSNPTA